jgi:hypothetical protein
MLVGPDWQQCSMLLQLSFQLQCSCTAGLTLLLVTYSVCQCVQCARLQAPSSWCCKLVSIQTSYCGRTLCGWFISSIIELMLVWHRVTTEVTQVGVLGGHAHRYGGSRT